MVKKFNDCLTKRFPRIKSMKKTDLYLIAFMIIISLAIFILVFKGIISFELKHAYCSDNPLYWAVGRGILNGLTPYSQLYENKPIGIFLLSALSFALTDDAIVGNIISCISALVITVVPALTVFDIIRKDDKKNRVKTAVVVLTVFLSGLLVAIYSETHSGGFQVEEIGSAFSVLFIFFTIKSEKVKTRKKAIILTALSSLMICFTTMMKEPFLLVSVFGALLFVNTIKDFIKRILIPCFAGGAFTVILLAVFGVLGPYFDIYIKRMFETRVMGDETSAFSRAVNILKLGEDMKNFSYLLVFIILAFLILTFVRLIYKKERDWRICLHILKVFAAIYIASFCVGLGGYYYNHHYIFAVPVYCALIIYGGAALYEIKLKMFSENGAVILLWGIAVFATFLNIGNPYFGDCSQKYNTIKEKANYVDSVLYYYNEDTYQYIGFNGEGVFIGLTKHSPTGPVFAQDADNVSDSNSWFSQQFTEQLKEANIIIIEKGEYYSLKWPLRGFLDREFTENPAKKNPLNPPETFNYKILYRVSKYC